MKEQKTVYTSHPVKQAPSSKTKLTPSSKGSHSPSPTWAPNTVIADTYHVLMGWTNTFRHFGLQHPKANTLVCLKKYIYIFFFLLPSYQSNLCSEMDCIDLPGDIKIKDILVFFFHFITFTDLFI